MLDRAAGPGARRRLGAWDTPPPLARSLTALALDHLGRLPEVVVDPSCGTGNFLVAAADLLVEQGVDPARVCGRLVGLDVDRTSVAAARNALAEWSVRRGLPATSAGDADLRVVDALADPSADLTGRVDLVVGNPPFLSQTAAATARGAGERAAIAGRFGSVGPYADAAALFLLLGLELLRDGGVAVLVQPTSFLSARDTAPVRERLSAGGHLVAVWGSDDLHFDAAVHVCAPVVRVGAGPAAPVDVVWGPSLQPAGAAPAPSGPSSWGPLLAGPAGIPVVAPVDDAHPRLDLLASAGAGFRDEFYALADAAREPGDRGHDEAAPRLVTVGMIDPFRSSWGQRSHRLGGRRVLAPRLDLDHLSTASPRVASWVARRRRPKVLVATQTRVVEAVVDPVGDWIPVTPVVSVEPHDGADVWRVAAALSSPSVAARLAAQHLGSGRAPGVLRCSPAALGAVPLPVDRAQWERGAVLARRVASADGGTRRELLRRLGRTMLLAAGTPADDDLLDWWCERAART